MKTKFLLLTVITLCIVSTINAKLKPNRNDVISIVGYISDDKSVIRVSNDRNDIFVIKKMDIVSKYKSKIKLPEFKNEFFVIEVKDNSIIKLNNKSYKLKKSNFKKINSHCSQCCESGCCKPYSVSCQGPQDCWLMGSCLVK